MSIRIYGELENIYWYDMGNNTPMNSENVYIERLMYPARKLYNN